MCLIFRELAAAGNGSDEEEEEGLLLFLKHLRTLVFSAVCKSSLYFFHTVTPSLSQPEYLNQHFHESSFLLERSDPRQLQNSSQSFAVLDRIQFIMMITWNNPPWKRDHRWSRAPGWRWKAQTVRGNWSSSLLYWTHINSHGLRNLFKQK